MQKLIKNLLGHKKSALLISVFYTLFLIVVCLVSLDGVPSPVIKHVDKIFHFLSYFILMLLWYNSFSKFFTNNFLKVIFLSFIFCVAFGIVVEGLQNTLTSSRTADIKDIIANTCGVLAGAILVKFLRKLHVKKL